MAFKDIFHWRFTVSRNEQYPEHWQCNGAGPFRSLHPGYMTRVNGYGIAGPDSCLFHNEEEAIKAGTNWVKHRGRRPRSHSEVYIATRQRSVDSEEAQALEFLKQELGLKVEPHY